jgi:formamidopyrimidine-DNA glycosylase
MPEVVEVRKYSKFILSKLKNNYITNIKILNGRYKKHDPFIGYNLLIKKLPIKVIDVKTKGKFLYIILENNIFILSTLGLSGGWAYKSNISNKFQLPILNNYMLTNKTNSYKNRSLKHLNIEFKTKKGSLFFYDTLSFGTMKIIFNSLELNKKLKSIGNDIMNINFNIFKKSILKKNQLNKPIGIVLINQKLISGIGNYLRSDILWHSKISPFKKLKDLNNHELKKIFNSAKLLTWSNYNYKKGVQLNYIKKYNKVPKDYGLDFFIYKQKHDIYGHKVFKKKLYEGSQKRMIYYVKEK